MYNKIIKSILSENEFLVLSEFTNGFKKGLYGRELSRRYGLPAASINLALKSLSEKGVLSVEMAGKTALYYIKKDDVSFEYLNLVEIYKKINFIESNLVAGRVVNLISPLISGIGAIFGSYSKGSQKNDSDMDIFVAGKADKENIKKISDTYNIDISLKVYSREEFIDLIDKDTLIKEVINSHVIICGFEEFLTGVKAKW